MKLRQARKILRDMSRPIFDGDKPYRHTWFQWTRATFVENRHMKTRVPMAKPEGTIMARTMGGLANENLSRIIREYGMGKEPKVR